MNDQSASPALQDKTHASRVGAGQGPGLQPNELPTLRPYLRVKYDDLPDDVVQELEELLQRHTSTGPASGEDET